MKNFLLFIVCVLMSSAAFGQTTIFSVDGGGALPTNWVGTNNVAANAIDRTSYYLVDAGSPSDIIETDVYDLSTYASATFTLDVATFGSGANNPAKIEISDDGGSSYTQVATSLTPTNSTYVTGPSIAISSLTSQVKIRISNNGASGKGVRMKNLVLEATGSTGPDVSFNAATSSETETNATFTTTIPVTMSNYGGSQVDLSVSVTGGTAESGDYTLNTSSLSFTANGTQNVSIDINPDADIDNETIELTIVETTSTGATITTSVHTITVSDDDGVLCTTPVWTIVEETLNSESDTWVENSGNYTVNGYVGSASASDLWLVYGPLDMSGTSTLNLNFNLVESFSGAPLNFQYSTDYAGDVSTATWTSVENGLTGNITGAVVNYGAAAGANTYIAIQYTADGLGSGGSASYALNNITMEADVCPSAPCVIANVAAAATCNGNDAEVVVSWTESGTSGTIQVDVNGNGYETMTSGGIYTITGPTSATAVTVTVRDANSTACMATSTVNIPECPLNLPIAFINEFHYDNDGGDVGEFVEIAIESSFAGNLADFNLSAYNGNGGATYDTETADNLTVGSTEQGFTFYTWTGINGGIQNGNDGFALSYQGTLLEFISYEGAFIATNGDANGITATDVVVAETSSTPVGFSIQRTGGSCTGNCPNGLTWTAPSDDSPGALNTNQLPVELLNFTATSNNQTTILTWSTAIEENNAYFNIQRSTDGKNFETIGTKTGAGTTYEVQEYSFIDESPINGLNYYRLQQVDFDGKFENHKIVSVLMNGKASDVQIYPNPTRGTLNIVLPTTGENEIQILDLTGKIVRTSITNDEGMTTLDISDLANGQYVIKIRNAQAISTALFVKTK